MKGYLILHFDLIDPEGFEKYKMSAGPMLKRFMTEGKAKLLVNTKSTSETVMEGKPNQHTQVIEFETPELAKEFYNLKEYRETIKYRTSSTDGWVLLTQGT